MARLRWTGGTFIDSSRGFKTAGGEHEFDDEDRVEEYLGHRSGNWERVEAPTDATADEEAVPETIDEEQADDDEEDEAEDVQEVSDEELQEVLDGTNDEVAEALATGEYDDHLDRLAELEAAGEDRKGAKTAIEERRED